jgi:tetratricopeptide (TPR) repeat protein
MRSLHIALMAMAASLVLSLPAAAQDVSTGIGAAAPARGGRHNVAGTVREAAGNRPLESVRVDLMSLTRGMAAYTFTNSNGGFAFSSVPDGTYYLVVKEIGYDPIRHEVNFSLHPGVGIQIELQPEGSLEPVPGGDIVSTRELLIPRRAREAMERGLNLLNEKSDYRGSLSQFERALREYPDYYEAYAKMGLAHMYMGEAAKSEELLRTAIEMSGRKYAEALFTLASVYSAQERFAEAEPLAREAVKLEPHSWRANHELASALHGLDQGEEAEASALQALRAEPENLQTILLLANIYLRNRNFTALIKDLDTYLELAPEGPYADQARRMRAQVLEGLANIQPRTANAP